MKQKANQKKIKRIAGNAAQIFTFANKHYQRISNMQNFSDGKVPVKDNKAVSLLHLAKNELIEIYEESELDNIAWWLLEHYSHINKAKLLLEPDIHVNQSCLIHFCNAVDELKKGIPVQYVIGVVDFYGLKLKVNPAVLIPRPETEEMVEIMLKENNGRENLKILDIGTGSGCIAISLAKNLKGSFVTAIDISVDALTLAKENAKQNSISNVEFLEMNFLEENYFIEKEFDIIVSNPPYIADSERSTLAKNVLDFEPDTALFVPDSDPLVFYKKMAELGATHLKRKARPDDSFGQGIIYAEINERLGEETCKIFKQDSFSSIILLKDMFGKNRFIKATRI